MLTIYLIVIGIGCIIFLISSYFDLLRTASSEAVVATSRHDIDTMGVECVPSVTNEVASAMTKRKGLFFWSTSKEDGKALSRQPVSAGVSPKEELQDIKQALVDKLDQKCVKLEKILEEKNRILEQLQKDLEYERSHRGEFASLQAILQRQIDDLKAQNRNLKDELERILQENLRLQTGMTMGSDVNLLREDLVDTKVSHLYDGSQGHKLNAGSLGSDEIIPSNTKSNNNQVEMTLEKEAQDALESSLPLNDIQEEDKSKGAGSQF